MMKKLLILMLVLGLASSASALLVTLDPTGAADTPAGAQSLNVDSDDVLPYDYFLAITDITYGDITAIAILPDAGDDAAVQNMGALGSYASVWRINALDSSAPFNTVPGTHFTAAVGFTGAAVGQNLTIDLLSDQLATIDSMTYNGIPEPMTIALLGLGGLFLLRRRK